MRALLIYALTLAATVWVVTAFAPARLEYAAAMAMIYAATIFDLRVANPRWSLFRRILPNVALLDCVVYGLPFAGTIALGEAPGGIAFVVQPILYFAFGIYFLFRWPHMRRGSQDDLSWLSGSMTSAERLARYLGRQTGRSAP